MDLSLELALLAHESGSAAGSVFILALLQGLTEFLPVSSSGHLVLAGAALDLPSEGRLTINVLLHVGTLFAVLAVYRADVWRTLTDLRRGERSMALAVFVGSIPAALIGIGVRPIFDENLNTPGVTSVGLVLTAVVLVCGEVARRARQRRDPCETAEVAGSWVAPRLGDALIVGLAQAAAILPGISRSGATIAVGMLRGMSPEQAARFSFLMSLVAIAGAGLMEVPDALAEGIGGLSPALVLGSVFVSALVGWVALQGLLSTLRRGAFLWFALYCLIISGLTWGMVSPAG